MSSGTALDTSLLGPSVTVGDADDPYLIEVIAPVESETKDATVAEIRGTDLPPDRATLSALSVALDQTADDLRRYARARARIAAITLG